MIVSVHTYAGFKVLTFSNMTTCSLLVKTFVFTGNICCSTAAVQTAVQNIFK